MRTKVDSDAIQSIGFDGGPGEHGILKVRFADGGEVLEYFDVPYSLYRKFLNAGSHGRFYNEHVRGRFKPKDSL